jgi:hypothetical protein
MITDEHFILARREARLQCVALAQEHFISAQREARLQCVALAHLTTFCLSVRISLAIIIIS